MVTAGIVGAYTGPALLAGVAGVTVEGASAASGALTGAIIGAGNGAIASYARGNEFEDILRDSLIGGAFGFVTGAVFGAASAAPGLGLIGTAKQNALIGTQDIARKMGYHYNLVAATRAASVPLTNTAPYNLVAAARAASVPLMQTVPWPWAAGVASAAQTMVLDAVKNPLWTELDLLGRLWEEIS